MAGSKSKQERRPGGCLSDLLVGTTGGSNPCTLNTILNKALWAGLDGFVTLQAATAYSYYFFT